MYDYRTVDVQSKACRLVKIGCMWRYIEQTCEGCEFLCTGYPDDGKKYKSDGRENV